MLRHNKTTTTRNNRNNQRRYHPKTIMNIYKLIAAKQLPTSRFLWVSQYGYSIIYSHNMPPQPNSNYEGRHTTPHSKPWGPQLKQYWRRNAREDARDELLASSENVRSPKYDLLTHRYSKRPKTLNTKGSGLRFADFLSSVLGRVRCCNKLT